MRSFPQHVPRYSRLRVRHMQNVIWRPVAALSTLAADGRHCRLQVGTRATSAMASGAFPAVRRCARYQATAVARRE